MRHWLSLFILVAAIMFLGSLGVGAQDGLELKGHLKANDTEREEGYFALADDTVWMVRPARPNTASSRSTRGKRFAWSRDPPAVRRQAR